MMIECMKISYWISRLEFSEHAQLKFASMLVGSRKVSLDDLENSRCYNTNFRQMTSDD